MIKLELIAWYQRKSAMQCAVFALKILRSKPDVRLQTQAAGVREPVVGLWGLSAQDVNQPWRQRLPMIGLGVLSYPDTAHNKWAWSQSFTYIFVFGWERWLVGGVEGEGSTKSSCTLDFLAEPVLCILTSIINPPGRGWGFIPCSGSLSAFVAVCLQCNPPLLSACLCEENKSRQWRGLSARLSQQGNKGACIVSKGAEDRFFGGAETRQEAKSAQSTFH